MFLTESFATQLDDLLHRICRRLQISSTQHQLAEERYQAIGGWLEAEGSPLAPFAPKIYPQGSLRIGTTVRPLERQEYDLDLVCELQIDPRYIGNPVDLLDAMETRLQSHATYEGMLERKNRCIRVNYANDFHLDILPACPDQGTGDECVVVPDRKAMEWRASNPKGYAAWFEERARLAVAFMEKRIDPLPDQEPVESKPPLKRVVQLLKRWRDIAFAKTPNLTPVSIVLTTLAGHHYRAQVSVNESVMAILDGICADIPSNGDLLEVRNPTNKWELLSERWEEDPGAYEAFVVGLVELRQSWVELNRQQGIARVAAPLKRLFGEEGTNTAFREQAEFVERMRTHQQLGIRKANGVLGALLPVASVPVRRNTFYGA